MSLKAAHARAQRLLKARPDCAAYLPAFAGEANPVPGEAGLKWGPAGSVAASIPEVMPHASGETRALTRAVVKARSRVDWWNAYDPAAPGGRGFATRSAACLLCGPGGAFTAPHGRAGFFYLREGVEYAPHRHRPREIYVLLAGQARFWNEATGWCWAGPGAVIHTPEESWHAMATPAGPVLILWCWIGEDFEGRPIFRDQTGALPA
ncbi:MAG: dimethylsulfonioproprionate lyase family protein [Pseudomonadota bacterium]